MQYGRSLLRSSGLSNAFGAGEVSFLPLYRTSDDDTAHLFWSAESNIPFLSADSLK